MKKLISLTAIVCMLISCQKTNESLTQTTQTNLGEVTKAGIPAVNTVIRDTIPIFFGFQLCNGDWVNLTGSLFLKIISHQATDFSVPPGNIVENVLDKYFLSGVDANGDSYKYLAFARTTYTDPIPYHYGAIIGGIDRFSFSGKVIKPGGAGAGMLSFDVEVGVNDLTQDPTFPTTTYKVVNIRGTCQ
jgi:hypothetical protein